MSGSFTAIYNTAQRVAVVIAFDPPRVTSRQVAELAGAGKLVDADGRRLAPFVIPPGTVRSLARRSRRGDAALGDRERDQMYDTMSRRARRLAAKASTPQDVAAWAKALREVERLGAQRAKSPAPSGPSTLGRSILDAHSDGVYTPERAQPDTAPEPPVGEPLAEPDQPEPREDEMSFGERLAADMRAELEASVAESPAAPRRVSEGGACDDSDIVRAERGHPAFGLHSRDFWKGRITRGLPSYGGPPGR